ncbi:MAG TPA: TIGR01777 family oxidoreductase [Gemmatimonadaceae bacterium]|nr:TIGR01777 family oxidoreductase [Gemmatimonadaceae bacterium]
MGISAEPGTERRARVVAISGSSGLVGSALTRSLEASGHSVRHLGRGAAAATGLDGADVVVNLAGENIAQRWSASAKRRIRESRVVTTTSIAEAMASMPHGPRVLVSGSAIGIYGSRGDELLDEASTLGDDFLASVCRDWEAATEPALGAGARVVHLRTGIVLSPHGGALAKMLPAFRLGAGGRMGSGRQWMSWISLPDMVRAIEFVIEHADANGAVNIVAPGPVTNAEFTTVLARVLHRPAVVPVPKFALSLMFGEMADGTVLASQRVTPTRLERLGMEFEHPVLESALRAVLD